MTDHRPLSFALEQKSDKFSPRQSRQLDFISRFDAKIVTRPATRTPVADALSRIDAITMPTTLNSAQISAEQQKDEQLTHLRGKAKLKLHDVVIDGLSLVCVEQRNGLKPYLPESLRRQAFDTAHTLSHPSGRATVKRVALLYFWPSMSKDIVRWAKQCVPCQQSKVHRHNRAELGNFVTPDGRFDHVHIDIVKMPLHQGFQNCLTMIDRYTRWPQAIPIGDIARPRHRGLSHFQASSSAYELPSKRTCKRRQRRWFSARRYAYPGSSSHDKNRTKRRRQSSFRLYGACFKQLDQCQRLGMFSIARSSSRTWQRATTTCFVGSTPFSSRSSSRIPDHTESSAASTSENFVVDVNGVAKTLSTDQLKPAYLDVADSGASQATPEQPTTTQPSSTRRVTFSLPAQTAQSIRGGSSCGASKLATEHSPVAPSAGPRAQRAPAAESAPVDLSHLRTAA
ncbi:unnamed protein product [Trichogramma brassicae]|uniref:RNA-directed DNA polymerase n=1 Tax=Trichogramma brassicae TaxID=86971 RepID=A0A6H5IU02_9HYME|nr:unnamed protein product [Trichogramma brassicae]